MRTLNGVFLVGKRVLVKKATFGCDKRKNWKYLGCLVAATAQKVKALVT